MAKTVTGKQPKKPVARKTVSKKPAVKSEIIAGSGIMKEYLKNDQACKVTFRLPRIAAPDAKRICIVGDFNNWSIHAHPMKKLKNGDYTITVELEAGREYQFRYLIDEVRWENDWQADKYVRSPYGDSDNSVVVL
ncbi:MAG TPA: isoamylase early set domain-containing protein [Syntrophobacteria bacterium]|nr:isoamylase early set domain-containing protein [Syntrophobacteria bacterium]